MSDSGFHYRQPPSPLIFTPDSVLSPPAAPSNHPSGGSNTVSMPFVRRHVTRRLKAAKAECDKELQRVTNNITSFFEERLREGDHETDRDGRERDRDRDSQPGDYDQYAYSVADLRNDLFADESSSDGGYEAELEFGSRHSRQGSFLARKSYPKTPS